MTTPRVARGEVPGVVLLTVAGANDRDQTHSGHKPYMVLADGLTRRGVAVLRCDDRGVGTSGGDLTAVAMSDLVGDALAMVRHLGRSEDVGPVGIIGNSEGSVVGAMAAAASPADVAFVVLLGGVGVRGADVIRTRLVAQAEAAGSSPADAEAAMAPFDELVEVVSSSGGIGAARLRAEQPNVYARLEAVAARAGERDPFLPRDLEQRVALFAGPWYHAQITLDGGMVLEDVEVPVLALTGTKDRTNLPEQNLPAIRAALERGGNPDFQVSEIADLNHVFQTAVEGGLAEYGRLEESFSPVAMELIGTWILERFGLAASGVGDGQPRSSMGR